MQSQRHQHIVGIHYALGAKIGEGSFGVIFEGENILNKDTVDPVAIKFEPKNSDAPQLRDEFRAYRILNDCLGIPHAYYYGQEGMHNVLVIDLLGPSLEDLFEWCGRKFSIKTTCLIAKQMIQRVRAIHEHDLIYRDIKPDNFLISEFQLNDSANSNKKYVTQCANNDPNLIYIVDFGMAKQYRDPRTKQHIPYRERKSLSGTARYMSINTHFGREQSRRDDLESLGHVFFYFLRGSLPWQGLKAPNNKLKYEKIGLTKQKVDPEDLLLNGSIPKQFATYLKYARNLKFEEEPDYDYLVRLMDDVLLNYNLADDGYYDWTDLNDGEGWNIKVNKRANLHGYGNPTPRNARQNNNSGSNTNNNNNNDTSRLNRVSSANYANRSRHRSNNTYSNINSSSNQDLTSNSKKYQNQNPSQLQQQQRHIKSSSQTYDSMGTRNYIPNTSNHNNAPFDQQQQHYNNDNFTSLDGSMNDSNNGVISKFISNVCCCCCNNFC